MSERVSSVYVLLLCVTFSTKHKSPVGKSLHVYRYQELQGICFYLTRKRETISKSTNSIHFTGK